ncbi:MAG: ChbG/HpnK family deacetylase [Lachnospiraceae bacterium]|nr:ChbG/HpnK family deacetylase [Lachnospiraceae bacterium]
MLTDYHADDYGLSMNNAIRMMQLLEAAKLDSISIIPNMSVFENTMEYLDLKWNTLEKKPLISIHLNIADGFSLSGIDDGFFTHKSQTAPGRFIFHTSWGRLLFTSYNPLKRNKVRALLTKEFKEQIKTVYDRLPADINFDKQLRLDSHTHTHMIPVVFDAMLDAVDGLDLKDRLSFVRVSAEPILPFNKIKGTYPKINLVKNIILNLLSFRAERILKKRGVSYELMWGLIMSGKMDKERIGSLMPAMKTIAENKGLSLEILCHPGIILPNEQCEEFSKDDKGFFASENRNVEYEAAMCVDR